MIDSTIGFAKFEEDFYADTTTMFVGRNNKTRSQFCKDVLDFLKSEYSDAYEFTIELETDRFKEFIQLKIKSGQFIRKITAGYMNYFYELYKDNKFIKERNQYLWQKELIDLIEGS